jgi:hypothetical protein
MSSHATIRDTRRFPSPGAQPELKAPRPTGALSLVQGIFCRPCQTLIRNLHFHRCITAQKTPADSADFCKRKVMMLKSNMESLHALIYEKRKQSNQVNQVFQMKMMRAQQQQQQTIQE